MQVVLFALVSACWPGVKLSCNKGLCASGCFFVVTTSFSLAGLYSLTFGAFGFGGLLRVFVVVFGGVFGVCACFGFRACDCFTSSVETHKDGLLRC